jgi:hypothetical protein
MRQISGHELSDADIDDLADGTATRGGYDPPTRDGNVKRALLDAVPRADNDRDGPSSKSSWVRSARVNQTEAWRAIAELEREGVVVKGPCGYRRERGR